MNNIFRLDPRILSCAVILTLGLGSLSAPPPAHAVIPVIDGAHIGSTLFAERMRWIDAAADYYRQGLQLRTLMRQYDDMVRQGTRLTDIAFNPLQDTISELTALYEKGKSLAHSAGNLDEQFRQQFKGYDDYISNIGNDDSIKNMPERYRQWSEAGFDNARLAMRAAGINVSAFADEEKLLQQLLERSRNAKGRLQAIQAGNEIAAQQVQQMQMLREMLATQITLQSNWMAQQTERDAHSNAMREIYYKDDVDVSTPSREFRVGIN